MIMVIMVLSCNVYIIDNQAIGLMSRMFANGLEDRGSILGRVIPKIQKWYLMLLCLSLSIIWQASRAIQGWSSAFLLHLGVVAIVKGAFGPPSTIEMRLTDESFSPILHICLLYLAKGIDLFTWKKHYNTFPSICKLPGPFIHCIWYERCSWCNGNHDRKWTWWPEFSSSTRQFDFYKTLIPLLTVQIQLFSLQLWVKKLIRLGSLTLL